MGRSLTRNVGLLLVGAALFVNGLVSALLLLNGVWPTAVAAGSVALVVLLAATAPSVVLSRRSVGGEDVLPASSGVETSVVGGVPEPA